MKKDQVQKIYVLHWNSQRLVNSSFGLMVNYQTQAKQKKMFVCENPGGQKNVHQAGRESIFCS